MRANLFRSGTASIIYEKRQKGKDIILKTTRVDPLIIDELLYPLTALVKLTNSNATLLISDSNQNISSMRTNHKYAVTDLEQNYIKSNHKRGQKGQPKLIVGSSQQVINHLRRDALNLDHIGNVVVDALNYQNAAAFSAHVIFVFQKFNVLPPTLLIAEDNIEQLRDIIDYLRSPVEIERIEIENKNNNKGVFQMNKADFSHISKDKRSASRIQGIVRKMVIDESPEELDEYRKLIRRNVSIFRRSYLTGYLFKILVDKDSKRGSPIKNKRSQPKDTRSHHRVSRNFPSSNIENNIRCLYINVGKIHGLTETALNEMVANTQTVDKDEIASYAILDRFTFINVPGNKADKLIHALNTIGRFGEKKMTTSYSHR